MTALKSDKEVQSIAEANSSFSASIYGEIKKSNSDKIIFSPFSISTVVAMAKLGAGGKTATEIAKGFNFPSDNEKLTKGYSQVLTSLKQSNDGYTLSAANKVYCKIGFELKNEFTQAVKISFGTDIEQIDFGKSDAAAKKINEWVDSSTNQKIKNLISPGSLSGLTAMVLINGVYFKGLWKHRFDPEDTIKDKFHLNDKTTREVDMMFQSKKFPYVELKEADACAVSLPYKGDRLSMLIYLPRKTNGLSTLEGELQNLTPSKVLDKMSDSTLIDVSLPRFTIETTLSLVEPLKNLGVKTMFTDGADFSGIPKSSASLYVSEVVHKAFIEVNEQGSEAAAATGMMVMARSLPITIPFKANHPFLFQIVDISSNFILFAGCYK